MSFAPWKVKINTVQCKYQMTLESAVSLIYFYSKKRWMTPMHDYDSISMYLYRIKRFVILFVSASRGISRKSFWVRIPNAEMFSINKKKIVSAKSCRVESHHIQCVCNWISIHASKHFVEKNNSMLFCNLSRNQSAKSLW